MDCPQVAPITSLYVGNLDSSIAEGVLCQKFSEFGKIISIRLCRDVNTGRSLGYAYVNFEKHDDAMKALDNLNLSELNGRFIRVMRCQRDPSARRSTKGNVYVKNLHHSITDRELYDTFAPFGEIMSCKIPRQSLDSNYGFGFVHFVDEDSADEAIKVLNGKQIRDRTIYVGRFQFRQKNSKEVIEKKLDPSQTFMNCYVKNLSTDVTEEALYELFSKFGTITSVKVMRYEDGKSKGFGFVCFTTHEAAVAAVSEMHGKTHNCKKLYVCRAQKKNERQANLSKIFESGRRQDGSLPESEMPSSNFTNLYLKNLEDTIDEDRLRAEFSPYGVITSAKVMTDEKGRSKGFGFVSFQSSKEAMEAMAGMVNKNLDGKPLFVAFAQKKEDRRKQLANQYLERLRQIQIINPAQSQLVPPTPPGFICRPIHPGGLVPQSHAIGQIRPVFGPQHPPIAVASVTRPVATVRPETSNMFPQTTPGDAITVLKKPSFEDVSSKENRAPKVMIPDNPVNIRLHKVHNSFPEASENEKSDGRKSLFHTILRTTNGGCSLSYDMLTNAPPQEQKQMFGERLFPLVHELCPERAGKVTGMLLEVESDELLKLLQNREALKAKVEEARSVLIEHERNLTSTAVVAPVPQFVEQTKVL